MKKYKNGLYVEFVGEPYNSYIITYLSDYAISFLYTRDNRLIKTCWYSTINALYSKEYVKQFLEITL